MDDRTKLMLGAALAVGIVITAAVLIAEWRIGGSGTIIGIGLEVYSDAGLTSQLAAISWGNVTAGDVIAYDMWILITENSPATLAMSLENWQPSEASQYISMGWDYAGNVVNPGQSLKVRLTMTLADNALDFLILAPDGEFAFDIVLTAMGQR